MQAAFAPRAMLFSIKSFVAAMLALYIALRIGIPNPYWALITTYVVAQPKAGAVLSKGTYRVIGTVVGAAVAVFLVPPLVNAPELLSGVIALWLGLCTFAGAIDRTSRSYMFVLAGYSTCIIAFPSVSQPDAVFTIAVNRVQEIALGIICSSVVHSTILPSSSADLLLARLDGALRDEARWIAEALSDTRPDTLDRERRRLAVAVNEMHDLLIHVGHENAGLTEQRRLYRALLAQIERVFPLSTAVDDRITEMRRVGAMTPAIEALLADILDWVEATSRGEDDRWVDAGPLRQHCVKIEPPAAPGMAWQDVLALSFLARLESLILVHGNCLLLRRALDDRSRDKAERQTARTLLAGVGRRAVDRDYAGAFAAAASTTTALFIACLLWIASGWEAGTNAVMMTGVFFAIYSGVSNPTLFLKNKFIGVVVRTVLAVVYVLVIIPAIDGFPLLVVALAPTLILSGALMTVPRFSPLAFNLIIGLFNPTIIADRFEPDFADYLNNSVATLTGIYFALIMMRMMQSLWLEGAAERLLKAGWIDIVCGRHEAVMQWRSRMGHRIALLAARSTNTNAAGERAGSNALRDLRAGIALAELAGLRPSLSQAGKSEADMILNGAELYYRDLLKLSAMKPSAALLKDIDQAMQTGLGTGDTDTLRRVMIVLASLRRTLFPATTSTRLASPT